MGFASLPPSFYKYNYWEWYEKINIFLPKWTSIVHLPHGGTLGAVQMIILHLFLGTYDLTPVLHFSGPTPPHLKSYIFRL